MQALARLLKVWCFHSHDLLQTLQDPYAAAETAIASCLLYRQAVSTTFDFNTTVEAFINRDSK